MAGDLGDDDLGLAQQLDGTDREQAGVTGAAAHEGDPLHAAPLRRAGCSRVTGVLVLAWSRSPSRYFVAFWSLAAPHGVDQVCGALGEHLGRELLAHADGIVERAGGGAAYGRGSRRARAPRHVPRVRHRGRLPQLRPARRPARSSPPRARRAPRARPRRRRGWPRRRGRRSTAASSSRRRRGTRWRAHPDPGPGSTWIGSSTSVTSSRRPRRARPARARTTASRSPAAHLARSGCRRCRAPRRSRCRGRAPRAGRRDAATRCRRGHPAAARPG